MQNSIESTVKFAKRSMYVKHNSISCYAKGDADWFEL